MLCKGFTRLRDRVGRGSPVTLTVSRPVLVRPMVTAIKPSSGDSLPRKHFDQVLRQFLKPFLTSHSVTAQEVDPLDRPLVSHQNLLFAIFYPRAAPRPGEPLHLLPRMRRSWSGGICWRSSRGNDHPSTDVACQRALVRSSSRPQPKELLSNVACGPVTTRTCCPPRTFSSICTGGVSLSR